MAKNKIIEFPFPRLSIKTNCFYSPSDTFPCLADFNKFLATNNLKVDDRFELQGGEKNCVLFSKVKVIFLCEPEVFWLKSVLIHNQSREEPYRTYEEGVKSRTRSLCVLIGATDLSGNKIEIEPTVFEFFVKGENSRYFMFDSSLKNKNKDGCGFPDFKKEVVTENGKLSDYQVEIYFSEDSIVVGKGNNTSKIRPILFDLEDLRDVRKSLERAKTDRARKNKLEEINEILESYKHNIDLTKFIEDEKSTHLIDEDATRERKNRIKNFLKIFDGKVDLSVFTDEILDEVSKVLKTTQISPLHKFQNLIHAKREYNEFAIREREELEKRWDSKLYEELSLCKTIGDFNNIVSTLVEFKRTLTKTTEKRGLRFDKDANSFVNVKE